MIVRYVPDYTANDDPIVLVVSRDPVRVVCGCRSIDDAEMIADALNDRGAVEALRELHAAVIAASDKSRGTPERARLGVAQSRAYHFLGGR